MSAETNNEPLLLVPVLTAKIEEAIDLLCAAFESHQVDTTTSARTMNALCDAYAFLTSGEAVTMENMAKLRDAAQQMQSADTDRIVDPNWVE